MEQSGGCHAARPTQMYVRNTVGAHHPRTLRTSLAPDTAAHGRRRAPGIVILASGGHSGDLPESPDPNSEPREYDNFAPTGRQDREHPAAKEADRLVCEFGNPRYALPPNRGPRPLALTCPISDFSPVLRNSRRARSRDVATPRRLPRFTHRSNSRPTACGPR